MRLGGRLNASTAAGAKAGTGDGAAGKICGAGAVKSKRLAMLPDAIPGMGKCPPVLVVVVVVVVAVKRLRAAMARGWLGSRISVGCVGVISNAAGGLIDDEGLDGVEGRSMGGLGGFI